LRMSAECFAIALMLSRSATVRQIPGSRRRRCARIAPVGDVGQRMGEPVPVA
jgi:hypothetical protein